MLKFFLKRLLVKQWSLHKFRDWFFNLLVDILVNSDWIIVVKDFKKSENKSERVYLGLTDYEKRIIYLDKNGGTPTVLLHEIGHSILESLFEIAAENLPQEELKKMKGKNRADKMFRWEELMVLDFEKLFYRSLSKRQIATLQGFVDEARERYKKKEG